MSLMSDKANSIHHQRGSSLLEGLLAIILFSMGLLSLLMLLSATLIESSNARYRIEASLLMSDLVSHMWIGDHSLTGLKTRFADTTSIDYQSWFTSVSNRLPGVSAKKNAPQITIDDERNVTVNIRWQVPGDNNSHQMIVQTLITD
jgi:type IV pilus assembly protein PilV